MDLETLQGFFFWCMVVNSGIYAATAISVLLFRDVICRIHRKIFGLNEEAACKSMQQYLAAYKLLITFFNFGPWIAILIMR